MDTDAHGSKTKQLSVSIRVNPWLKLDFSASCEIRLATRHRSQGQKTSISRSGSVRLRGRLTAFGLCSIIPQTHAERFLVEQLAVIQWKLGRWETVESAAVLESTTVCLAFHDLREYETEKGTVRVPDTMDKREDRVNRTLDRYSQFTSRPERSGRQHPAPASIELPIVAAAPATAQVTAIDLRPDVSAPSRADEFPSQPVGTPDYV
jgi:hypothetical protein